ncbi:MAG: transglycosylase family protein [Nostocoides sp.]
MFYAAKHARTSVRPIRRAAGVAVTSAATVAGGLAVAPSALASTTSSTSATSTVWDRVAACESGGNWSINTGNGYYGGLQFSYGTWRAFGGAAYAATANRATKAQQITIAQKVLKVQGSGAWPTCSVRAGLTRSNGAAASTGVLVATPAASRSTTRVTGAKGKRTGWALLAVDGQRGSKTNRALEKWVGGSVNGRVSTSDWRKLEKKIGGSVNGSMSRSDVRKLQKIVGATTDGSWGPLTTRALQRYLNRNVL